MFDDPTIQDLQVKPDLLPDESVIAAKGTTLEGGIRENAIVTVTTHRIITGAKKGRSVDEEHDDKLNLDIELDDVDTLRRTGMATKAIEVVTNDDEVCELPPLQNGSGEIVDAIISQAELGKTSWGEESRAKRGTKKVVGGIVGVLGLVIGGLCVLGGIAGILSILGILWGVILFFGGVMIVGGSMKLIQWAYGSEDEWDRNEPYNATGDDPADSGDVGSGVGSSATAAVSGIADRFGVPPVVWTAGVLLGAVLWLALFALLNQETLFGVALFAGWIILPISVYLDISSTSEKSGIKFRWWAYCVPSVIPFIAPLAGFTWLARKRQKTGSIL